MIFKSELVLRIILEDPTPGVDYGLQEGKGIDFTAIQIQTGKDSQIEFNCKMLVKMVEGLQPIFLGPYAQGPSNTRFIYIDIGTCAGQKNSPWQRRLKIPLTGIPSQMILAVQSDSFQTIETTVAGTGKDGGPNCGTVKPFNGWYIKHT